MSADHTDIVIVEDNPNDAELLTRALGKLGAPSLIVLHDGAEALDFLFAEGCYAHRPTTDMPRVILLDLKLPKVDGIEVLCRLKGDARTKSIPVVILTSSTEERDLKRAYDSGANSYVAKPIESREYAAFVAELGHYWLAVNRLPT